MGAGQEIQEDCIGFNNATIEVKQVDGRWKIIDGAHWIIDFGSNKAEASDSFEIMKRYQYNQICFVGRPGPSMTYFKAVGDTTSAFVVRHAEKQDCPPPQDQQCPLTTDGESRAQTLAAILSNSGVSGVLSTNTVRTFETANNTAQQAGLNVQTYGAPAEAVQLIKGNHRGQTVLVVGHSNTVPQIIQGLGIDSIPMVGNQFNNLFLVTIAPTGEASLTHLKYEIQRD